jgi:hypothetical protein
VRNAWRRREIRASIWIVPVGGFAEANTRDMLMASKSKEA